MSKQDDKGSLRDLDLAQTKKEFIETFFRRAADFTEELIRENEKLRYRIVQLEQVERRLGQSEESHAGSGAALRELVARIEVLEGERKDLLSRFQGVEAANHDYMSRYQEIERENNNLANLYVASHQLHSTMDLREVTQIILEILLNFIGAKTFAIQLVDAAGGRLRTLAAEGIARDKVPEGPVGEGKVGAVLSSAEPYFDEERLRDRAHHGQLDRPMIVVPLRIRENVVGVVVIWDLLSQKTHLADVDYELFNLLGGHAACALTGAKLTSDLNGRSPALWGAADLV
jgi:hypothetical protein